MPRGDRRRPTVETASNSTPDATVIPNAVDRGYVDLVVASAFSFLRGASMPEELVQQAAALGAAAVSLTDRHSVAGIVRAKTAAAQSGIRLVPGTRVELWKDLTAACQHDDWDRRSPISPPGRSGRDGAPRHKSAGVGDHLPAAHDRQAAGAQGAMPTRGA